MTGLVRIPNNWNPRPYQLPVLRYFANGGKRAVLQWSRRLGKDDVSMHHTAMAMLSKVGTYWHMLPEYAQARKAIWDAVDGHTGKRRIDWVFPKELRQSTNEVEMKITLKNGSVWQVVGSDRYDSLVGSGVVGVVFSEFSLCKPEAWGYISPMLEENGGWALFNYTVRGENHATQLARYAQNDPQWFFSNVLAEESGVFTKEQLRRIEKELIGLYGKEQGKVLFRQEYYNDTGAALPGSIYGLEMMQVKEEGRIKPLQINENAPVYTFWDLGVDDSTAIIFAQFYDGKIWIVDFYENRNVGMPHYLRMLEQKAYERGWEYAVLTIPHDGENREWTTGATRREMLEQAGYEVVVLPNERIVDGINAARGIFPRCVFDIEKAKRLLECLGHYKRKWDNLKKTYSKEPQHDWASHACDSFRYLAMGAKPQYNYTPVKEEKKTGLTFNDLMRKRKQKRSVY